MGWRKSSRNNLPCAIDQEFIDECIKKEFGPEALEILKLRKITNTREKDFILNSELLLQMKRFPRNLFAK